MLVSIGIIGIGFNQCNNQISTNNFVSQIAICN